MRSFRKLLRDEQGSETIQFVLFVPLFAALLVIITDASFLYLTHTEMWNVARDTARRMAAGQLTSAEQARDYAATHMTMFNNQYQFAASHDPDTKMIFAISVPIADAMILGNFLQAVIDDSITVQFEMRSEPEINGGGGGSV